MCKEKNGSSAFASASAPPIPNTQCSIPRASTPFSRLPSLLQNASPTHTQAHTHTCRHIHIVCKHVWLKHLTAIFCISFNAYPWCVYLPLSPSLSPSISFFLCSVTHFNGSCLLNHKIRKRNERPFTSSLPWHASWLACASAYAALFFVAFASCLQSAEASSTVTVQQSPAHCWLTDELAL